MYQIRTIDVWDTLLRRTCHPDFIKLATARHLVLGQYSRLRPEYRDHWAVLKLRCQIEGELAKEAKDKGKDDEYTLEAVLGLLSQSVFTTSEQTDSEWLRQLAARELEMEHQHTYPDPTCRAFLKQFPAEKSLFLSDFYMSSHALLSLLERHGLRDIVDEGISSCDIGLNKRSGNLFRHIQSVYAASPERHVHIGDNPHSDVEIPSGMGIRTQHYQPETEHAARQMRERLFSDRTTLFEHIEKEAVRIAEADLADAQPSRRSAYLLGVLTAPMLIGFMVRVAELAILDKVEKLFFFTREGEFFIQVFKKLFPDSRLAGLPLPPTGLLEVSRLATFCASLQEISARELMRLWNLYSTQSMLALFKSLGLAPESLTALCARHGLTLADAVIYPWQDERVLRLLDDAEFRDILTTKIANDRVNLLAYLRQTGWDIDRRTVGIVDIGWRGTIQDNLALLMPSSRVCGYYLGLQRFLNAQPVNCDKHAFGPNLNKQTEFAQLLDAVAPIEMICNSPHGSVTGYRKDADDRVTAIRLVDDGENSAYEAFTTHFQEGILHAAATWAKYLDNHAIASIELRPLACAIWDKLISTTPEQLLETFTSLNHNETFGVGGFVDKQEVPGIIAIWRHLLSRQGRLELIFFLKKNQWPHAMWRRKDIRLGNRIAIVTLMLAAQLYKRARAKLGAHKAAARR